MSVVYDTTLERFWNNLKTILDGLKTDILTKGSATTYTLEPSGWTGDEAPYTYTLNVPGVTPTGAVTTKLSNSLSDEEYLTELEVQTAAKILRIKQGDNSLTFMAYGDKPASNLIFDIGV